MFTCTSRGSHFGSKLLKSATKISSLVAISRVFPWKFLQIHITSVSGCLRFTFKICQTVAGTSYLVLTISTRFWRVFQYGPTVGRLPSPLLTIFCLPQFPCFFFPFLISREILLTKLCCLGCKQISAQTLTLNFPPFSCIHNL